MLTSTDVVFHATALELLWTGVTLVGVVVNLWGLVDAVADRRWLRSSGLNGRRETVARWHVVLNAGLTWVQAAFLVAGVTACFTRSSTGPTHVARVVVQVLFLSAEPVLVLVAIEAHRYRRRLLATRSLATAHRSAARDSGP
jgi:hypothetical protein